MRNRGRGVAAVVTELGVLRADETGELCLAAVHEGVRVDDVVAATGWPLKVSADVAVTEPPTGEELRLLREEIDPGRGYLR